MKFCEVRFYDENHNNLIEKVIMPLGDDVRLQILIKEQASKYLETGKYKKINWSIWKEVSSGSLSK
ncbi:hypothetical protein BAOM_3062 [Peribacillus asahii]|uniref:Uncharacterized protein n=1 Tax=Peribacillus asahii TaxID=228899 RepID=A0A3T0KTZ9_9BACI|nr:hypothetical protein [Peribacillus asahii]AZV43671.1 hypothetical protein BAOM_3062 [Peribacillus asahii]